MIRTVRLDYHFERQRPAATGVVNESVAEDELVLASFTITCWCNRKGVANIVIDHEVWQLFPS